MALIQLALTGIVRTYLRSTVQTVVNNLDLWRSLPRIYLQSANLFAFIPYVGSTILQYLPP